MSGTVTGILSAFGVGGGTLLLTILSAFAGIPQQTAQGINLLYFLPASAASLPSHVQNGLINRASLFPAVCAGILGTTGFAWLATAMDTHLLRRFFGAFLLAVGLLELLFGTGTKKQKKNRSSHASKDERPC